MNWYLLTREIEVVEHLSSLRVKGAFAVLSLAAFLAAWSNTLAPWGLKEPATR